MLRWRAAVVEEVVVLVVMVVVLVLVLVLVAIPKPQAPGTSPNSANRPAAVSCSCEMVSCEGRVKETPTMYGASHRSSISVAMPLAVDELPHYPWANAMATILSL